MRRLLLALAVAATPSAAHHAPAGWLYGEDCCSDRDCAQIDDVTVKVTAEGYEVTLVPGDHHMVTFEMVYLVAFDDHRLRQSKDEFFHACIGASNPSPTVAPQRLICLYKPAVLG